MMMKHLRRRLEGGAPTAAAATATPPPPTTTIDRFGTKEKFRSALNFSSLSFAVLPTERWRQKTRRTELDATEREAEPNDLATCGVIMQRVRTALERTINAGGESVLQRGCHAIDRSIGRRLFGAVELCNEMECGC